jgi:hypothetical protein
MAVCFGNRRNCLFDAVPSLSIAVTTPPNTRVQ